MKKICLSLVGIILAFFVGFGQNSSDTTYKRMDLHVEEVNILSSYYSQTGNHSAITGGIGTQRLTDVSNIVQLKLARYDLYGRKKTVDWELGIDHHTAASSAYVSKTGASATGGTRIYPSVTWKIINDAKRQETGFGLTYSNEYNYKSYGANVSFAKRSIDENREVSLKAQVYFDRVKMIQPSEFAPTESSTPTYSTITTASGRTIRVNSSSEASSGIPSESRNTLDLSYSVSQVINKKLQIALVGDFVGQNGYLGLPFHRVYFTDGTVKVENLPSSRFKLPIGVRANYYLSDRFILRSFYRFYTDNWGVTSHSASLELPVKLTQFVSVSPFYRFYTQTASNYFRPYSEHALTETYYTSNYDYAAMNSQYVGINVRIAPPKGVFGIKNWNMLELRTGLYQQTTGLEAYNLSLNLRFK